MTALKNGHMNGNGNGTTTTTTAATKTTKSNIPMHRTFDVIQAGLNKHNLKPYGITTNNINNVVPPMKSSWGWNRQDNPTVASEVTGYNSLPWVLIVASNVILSSVCTKYLIGWPHASTYAPYLWIICLLIFGAVFALPCFAFVTCLHSYACSPAGRGNPEEYFEFVNKSFESSYRGRKIPLLTLYEAYFRGDINLKRDANGKEYDLLDVLYQRYSYARFIIQWEHAKWFIFKFIPELLTHSRSQDVEQVREHYDRGDDFYAAFLGPSMVYTSGIFHNIEDSLEESQLNKMNLVAQKIHLKKGDTHLDFGCGWGAFITHCARVYGTDSTGVTLGKNQTEWANKLIAEAGVSKSARALCMDYRDAVKTGRKYNKITCLEMSEHVGVKYYARFCKQVYDMLEDDGVFFLQIAGLRRPWQYEDLLWGIFMGTYVFPGADASCPLGWVINQLEHAGFEVRSEETIGVHYSATIKRWYDNWQSNRSEIVAKYGERWFRVWSWFLGWSVISPEQGSASCYQIVCYKNTRSLNRREAYIGERNNWKI
jgi:cyclopropane fatty-acyl-phospholipid synthase-like methyltransferase